MLVRSVSFGAALAAVVVLPLACGTFSADSTPTTGADEAGAGDAGAEGGGEGGADADGEAIEASVSSAPFELSIGHKDLRAIAATETDVFFVDQGAGGGVFAVPIIGGDARVLATGGAPSSIAVGGDFVYWTDQATRTATRAAIAGGATSMRRSRRIPLASTGLFPSLEKSAARSG
jgi:hypothetical protein